MIIIESVNRDSLSNALNSIQLAREDIVDADYQEIDSKYGTELGKLVDTLIEYEDKLMGILENMETD